ncbi:hypothetical protein LTR37_017924 [Vermiconidia calcicola]|uniref:Uncharacterized protein n=1 Tax=Vermiconidia calcicola TaxID=1690605 RepID=A0ACC3MJT7_9PEZI|nr:hypothetical protein LTR37_017924 [Vermiconidia calcicola]
MSLFQSTNTEQALNSAPTPLTMPATTQVCLLEDAFGDMTLDELDEPEGPINFLTLPPELRNRIYNLVALSALHTHVTHGRPPGLLAACRQVRAEFSNLYFHHDTWHAKTRFNDARTKAWRRFRDTSNLRSIARAVCGNPSPGKAELFGRSGVLYASVIHNSVSGHVKDAREHVEAHPPARYPMVSVAGFLVFPAATGFPSRRLMLWNN